MDMLTLSKNITISAPPEKIFDVIADTANIPKIWHNLSNIRNLKSIPNGGHSFQFDYSMASIRIEGSSIDLEYVRPNRIVTQTRGGILSTLTWTLEPQLNGSKTTVTLEVKYEIPTPLVGRLAEIVIAKINETDIVYVLNFLKLKLES
jgi:uncharacterized protein YndB with AHSA1/START domain